MILENFFIFYINYANIKENNLKITIGVGIVLIITFSVLVVTEKIFDETFSKVKPSPVQGKDGHVGFTNEDFFSSDFSHNRTAFLVGSSHIQNLDIPKINNLIQSDDLVTIYNFERGGGYSRKKIEGVGSDNCKQTRNNFLWNFI